jgi:protein-L-isoaspartate(D-aspartate) O-methyltransferase
MVQSQIEARGVRDPRVLDALRRVPRHRFVPEDLLDQAYEDGPLPIGEAQTISQPYIVALMTECLGLSGGERVLEIGTGSGYQTAVLAELAREVFTIEILAALADSARARIERLGYPNVRFRSGDGRGGWPEEAPFDGILVAAAADQVPLSLVDQLGPAGRLVLPLGTGHQDLWVLTRTPEGVSQRCLIPVRFVPLVRT